MKFPGNRFVFSLKKGLAGPRSSNQDAAATWDLRDLRKVTQLAGFLGDANLNWLRLMFEQRPGTPRPTIKKWMEMVISKHFLCKDWVHHPIETLPFINGWPWGSREVTKRNLPSADVETSFLGDKSDDFE